MKSRTGRRECWWNPLRWLVEEAELPNNFRSLLYFSLTRPALCGVTAHKVAKTCLDRETSWIDVEACMTGMQRTYQEARAFEYRKNNPDGY